MFCHPLDIYILICGVQYIEEKTGLNDAVSIKLQENSFLFI